MSKKTVENPPARSEFTFGLREKIFTAVVGTALTATTAITLPLAVTQADPVSAPNQVLVSSSTAQVSARKKLRITGKTPFINPAAPAHSPAFSE